MILPKQLVVLVGGDRETTWLDDAAGGPREIDRANMTSWAKKIATGGHIAIGEKYWGAELFVPRYAPSAISESLRWSVTDLPTAAGRAGEPLVKGFRAEAYPIWPFDGLKFYMAARALWSADQAAFADPMPAVYSGLFGAAATPMTQYFALLESTWTNFPTSDPDLYAHHTSQAHKFDRGSFFQWVDYPAGIINYRDDPGILALYQPRIAGLLGYLDQAKVIFASQSPKPTEYYRVLIFDRGARFLAAMADFEDVEAQIVALPTPTTLDQATAIYNAAVTLDGDWTAVDAAYATMCHPPASQLPAGVTDDQIGVPRLGEAAYRTHYRTYLPTAGLQTRVNAAITWFGGHGYPMQQQALQAIYGRIWN